MRLYDVTLIDRPDDDAMPASDELYCDVRNVLLNPPRRGKNELATRATFTIPNAPGGGGIRMRERRARRQPTGRASPRSRAVAAAESARR